MTTVKVNYIKDAHNNEKNYFDTDIPKKVLKLDQKHQRYGEICKTYKNSQKPAERQSDRHVCFLKTTGNLILISITEKILKIEP